MIADHSRRRRRCFSVVFCECNGRAAARGSQRRTSVLLKIAQGVDMLEDFFEVVVGDFAFEGGDEGAGFVGCVATEGCYRMNLLAR